MGRYQDDLERVNTQHRNGTVSEWPENRRGDAYEPPAPSPVAACDHAVGGLAIAGLDCGNGAPWPEPLPFGEVPKIEPFPIEVLPDQLSKFVKDAAPALNCPLDYIGVPLLTLAGGAIGASRELEIKSGWRERPCLYAAIVAPPGSTKTAALKLAALPFYREQTRRRVHYRRQKIAFEESPDGSVPKPIRSTVYVGDITTESLADLLQENPRGVAMIRDELTAWVASLDQYRATGRGADRQFYLATWSGEPVSVHRKNQEDGPVFVPDPFVSVVGGLPPALLFRLRGERALADGFLDRILFAYPDPTLAVGETWACVSDEGVAVWSDILSFLWALQPESDGEGAQRPRFVRLTSSGRAAWERFTTALAAELNSNSLPDCLCGPWAKMKGYCARLALIFHCLRLATREVEDENVDGDSVDRASVLVRYFQSHARKCYAELNADSEIDDARRVLDWIVREKATEFRRWEAHKDLRNKGRFPRVEDMDKPLQRLVMHRFIRVRPVVHRTGPGRPSDPVYEVSPLVNRRENRVNRVNSRSEA
jgi:hypothetical protein